MENILKESALILVVISIFGIPGIILLLFEDTNKLKSFITAHNRFSKTKSEVNFKYKTKIGLFFIYMTAYIVPLIIFQRLYDGIFNAGIIPFIILSIVGVLVNIFEYPYKRLFVKFTILLKAKFKKSDNVSQIKEIN